MQPDIRQRPLQFHLRTILLVVAGFASVFAAARWWAHRGDPKLIPLVLKLEQGDDGDKQRAANELAKVGRLAVPELMRIVRDSQTHERSRFWAIHGLSQIGPSAWEAVPALIESCIDAESHIDRRFQLAMLLEAFADRLGRELR